MVESTSVEAEQNKALLLSFSNETPVYTEQQRPQGPPKMDLYETIQSLLTFQYKYFRKNKTLKT